MTPPNLEMLVNVGRKYFSNRTSLSAVIDSTDDFQNSYTYDALNRLTRLDQSATGSASVAEKRVNFAYNAIGQFTSIARFNDLDGTSVDEVATSTYSYDTLGRMTDLAYKHSGTNLFTLYQWSYDYLNRVTQFVSADGTSDYTYDKTSQLTDADHDYQTDEAYTYDDNGNRTMTGYATGDNNQLLNDGAYSYTYDDEGNRLTRTNDTTYELTEYEWDFRNRLIRVTDKDEYEEVTQVVAYTYDVFNRRIAKAVDTSSPFNLADAAIERYVYDDLNGVTSVDGGNVVLDFLDPDGSGSSPLTLNSRQLFGNAVDQILTQEDVDKTINSADRVVWHLGDHLATVRDLVKNDGALGEHYEYDSYGQVVSGDTSITRYLYTSREYDVDTGLQYNRARWYDAETGRWISEDPLSFEADDTNLGRYVGNSPTNYIDPTGLEKNVAQLLEEVRRLRLELEQAKVDKLDKETIREINVEMAEKNKILVKELDRQRAAELVKGRNQQLAADPELDFRTIQAAQKRNRAAIESIAGTKQKADIALEDHKRMQNAAIARLIQNASAAQGEVDVPKGINLGAVGATVNQLNVIHNILVLAAEIKEGAGLAAALEAMIAEELTKPFVMPGMVNPFPRTVGGIEVRPGT